MRRRLEDERAATDAQVAALTRSFDDIVQGSELVNTDDEHDPEGATIAFERAQVSALLDAARQHLSDLDDALVRLVAGGFGVCDVCVEAIDPDRLVALPATRLCVRCAA